MNARMDCRQIVAPLDRGEARIPALVTLPNGRLLLFYDERPAPASGNGSDFNGLTMASDLPNPNRIRWVERTFSAEGDNASRWSTPRDLPLTLPAITSDACVGIDGDGLLHLACASTQGQVGYMDSRTDAEHLQAILAWGSGPEDLQVRDLADELYSRTGADALFATSGSTVTWQEAVLLPYVVRVGNHTHVQVVAVRDGEIQWLSDPLVGPQGVLLDETTLALWDGRVVANCRLQGFEGRGAGGRFLAWGDGRSWAGGQLWECEDPGCNAKAMGDLFVHPHSLSSRSAGTVVRLSPPWEGNVRAEAVAALDGGEFGYSDVCVRGDEVVVVFERDRGLWDAVFSMSELVS
jgi:putative exo-alpha-sialidase